MTGTLFIQHFRLSPGDTIVAKFKEKVTGLISLNHFVVYIGGNSAVHNIPGAGVVEISMDDVAANYTEISRIERFRGDVQALYARARHALGMEYHTIKFNCESLANYVRYGSARSEQVKEVAQKFLLGMALIALIAAMISIIRKAR